MYGTSMSSYTCYLNIHYFTDCLSSLIPRPSVHFLFWFAFCLVSVSLPWNRSWEARELYGIRYTDGRHKGRGLGLGGGESEGSCLWWYNTSSAEFACQPIEKKISSHVRKQSSSGHWILSWAVSGLHLESCYSSASTEQGLLWQQDAPLTGKSQRSTPLT